MPYSDRELLARLIFCEAGGEGITGMEAVASVIMNRVYATYGEYSRVGQQGNIRNVVFQPGQFTCARTMDDGVYNPQNIYNVVPSELSYAVADWALAGNRLLGLGNALWFFNPTAPACPSQFPNQSGLFTREIGEHCFYDPTQYYAST